MNNWAISKRVTVTCAVLLAFIVALGFDGLIGANTIKSKLTGVSDQAVPGLINIGYLRSAILEIRGSTLLMFAPGMEEYKRDSAARIAQLEQDIPSYLHNYEASIVATRDRELFEKLKSNLDPYLKTCADIRQLVGNGKIADASSLYDKVGKSQFVALRQSMDDEFDFNRTTGENYARDGISVAHTVSAANVTLLVLAIVSGITLAWFVIIGINRALGKATKEIGVGAEQVATASAEVASASQNLAQGASEQAATLQETSASGHEISAMTQRNAENSRLAANLMTDVDQRVGQANTRLEQLIASMSAISNSSERIAKIIRVIDEIAFQTNILALNAAVEAARAGEAGMGFAVVADEVRNLAQRCAQAARDTTALIEESVENARAGSTRLGEVAEVIHGITESAQKVKMLVDEVNLGGNEQARGIEQISRALAQMEQVTQQTAASAEESASASQELKAQSDSMQAIVAVLESLVSGKSQPAAPKRVITAPKRSPKLAKPMTIAPTAQINSLVPLGRAVGAARGTPRTSAPAPVAAPAALDKSSFPLDEGEFREF